MYPIVTILGKQFGTYMIMSVIGLLIAGFVFCRMIARRGLDDNDAIVFLLIAAVGLLIGGHLMFALTRLQFFRLFARIKNFKEFLAVMGGIFGGMVFYGGLLGAYGTAELWIRIKKLPRGIYLDCAAFMAPFFHSFARVGCFLAGCCYGIESNFGFCAHGNTLTEIGDVRRFPVQLLEAVLNLGIALLMLYLLKKKKQEGKLFYIYLAIYAVVRFSDEFLRGDEVRGFLLGLSTSQFVSILVETYALFMLFVLPRIKKQKVTEQTPPELPQDAPSVG